MNPSFLYGVGIFTLLYIMWATYTEIAEAHYMKKTQHHTILNENDIPDED